MMKENTDSCSVFRVVQWNDVQEISKGAEMIFQLHATFDAEDGLQIIDLRT